MTIGPFWTGDLPAEPLRITVYRDGEPANLDDYTGIDVKLYLGPTIIEPGLTGTIDYDESQVVLDWPDDSPFTLPGVYSIRIALTATNVWENMEPEIFVVQEVGGQWYNLGDARADWPDAPLDDAYLYRLLDVAGSQVYEIAPDFETVGENLRMAQIAQARALWSANRANQADQLGSDIYPVRVFPMDWTILNMIRPRPGVRAAW